MEHSKSIHYPIAGGMLKVYRGVGDAGHLSYTGQSSFKYIPVDEDVELNLRPAANVVVEPKLMSFESENYTFDRKGNVSGWDEIRTFNIEVRNMRDICEFLCAVLQLIEAKLIRQPITGRHRVYSVTQDRINIRIHFVC